MELHKRADYAVRVLLDLALNPTVTTSQLAQRQKMPPAYLAKILRPLSGARLVRTSRGRKGGLELARVPEEITLKQIVEATEGPTAFNRCLIGSGDCGLTEVCPMRQIWKEIQEVVAHKLETTTLAQLAGIPQTKPIFLCGERK